MRIFHTLGGPWCGLAEALRARAGGLVESCELPAPGAALARLPFLLELEKSARATGAVMETLEQVHDLYRCSQLSYALLSHLTEQHRRAAYTAFVTTCTYDLLGATLVFLGKQLGVPVVHVQHACTAFEPEEAWFCREYSGDLVLVPGERDREWWQHCAPDVQVEVAGNPLWDKYATLRRVPHTGKVVLWAAESGANADQTPRYWESRNVPQRAWHAFLGALRQYEEPLEVLIKFRRGEDLAFCEQSEADLRRMGRQHSIHFLQSEPLEEELLRCDLVVCQESNLGIEALHLGIPVASWTRSGQRLFRTCGDVELVDSQETLLHAMCFYLEEGPGGDAVSEARYYNRGVDGKATEHMVQRILEAVS